MRAIRLAALSACLLVLVLAAGLASAHATLISSDPADGGTLTATPHTITLVFDEELGEGSSVVVRDAAGAEVASGGISEELASAMTAELPAVADGKYVVFWTAVTPDDQAVERGSYAFTVAAASASPAATSAGPSPGGSPTSGNGGQPTSNNSDLLLALLIAAVAIAAVVGFLLYRNRR